jgi:diaminopimelate decarboxylase
MSVHALARPLALVDETVALRRCALYRNAFKGTAVSYPAALLRFNAVAAWMLTHRVTVDVSTSGELDRALAAGIDPRRIVICPRDGGVEPIRRAVKAGAARFVVGSTRQIAHLVECADRIQPVVVDLTRDTADTLVSTVLAHRELDPIGLHCRIDDPDDGIGAAKLRETVVDMWRIRRERDIVLGRISLAGLDIGEWGLVPRILRRVAEATDEVVGDTCAHNQYPRPALTVAPRHSAFLPSG